MWLSLFLQAIVIICLPTYSYAFKIEPLSDYNKKTTQYDVPQLRSIPGIENKVPKPIHENLTLDALKLVDKGLRKKINLENVITGVRWNDDPLHEMTNSKNIIKDIVLYSDFYFNFEHSCEDKKYKKTGPAYDLLYRTHCGDMQFLHAQASSNSEVASVTLDKVMMWLEFTYKVATGEIAHNHNFGSLTTPHDDHESHLSPKSASLFNDLMLYGDARAKWQPELMFTFSCHRVFKPTPKCDPDYNHDMEEIRDIALGSALHLIQDSYSDSHISREPEHCERKSIISNRGKIISFYTFSEQDDKKHAEADVDSKKEVRVLSDKTIGLDEISRDFILKVMHDRETGEKSWLEVKEHLQKIAFGLVNENVLPIVLGKYQKNTAIKNTPCSE
jgi:hypothetical protein